MSTTNTCEEDLGTFGSGGPERGPYRKKHRTLDFDQDLRSQGKQDGN